MQDIVAAFRISFKRWFPQRNLIVVSEHKVRHIPISGGIQCAMLMVLGGLVCWGAYSTGSYMAVRMALKSQNQALRSIADARVNTNFNNLYPSAALVPGNIETMETPTNSLASPMFALSALGNDRLLGRVAYLEQKVAELQSANNTIVQRVREKSAGRISEIETLIRQIGMNPNALKQEAAEKKLDQPAARKGKNSGQGGPYIPADTLSALSPAESDMYRSLDQLALLETVFNSLPLAFPMKNAEEQSRFGNRIDPFTRRLAFHSGLDFSGPAGSRVYSTAPGKVVTAQRNGAYGNMVDVQHEFGISTRYAHLSQILVSEGQMVNRGDLLGVQGSTGRSTGQHLHYEVRYNDRPMNPKNFLKVAQNVSQK